MCLFGPAAATSSLEGLIVPNGRAVEKDIEGRRPI